MPTALLFDNADKIITGTVLVVMLGINLWLARHANDHPAGAVWRDHPRLMWSSMAFIALLVVFTALDLVFQAGVLGKEAFDGGVLLVGFPASLAALWVIFEAVRVGYAILASEASRRD